MLIPEAEPGDLAIINVTTTGAVGVGYGTLRSSDQAPVFSLDNDDRFSSVNFAPDEPVDPNLAVASVGFDQAVCYDAVEAEHDVVLDLAGVIAGNPTSDPVSPIRLVDTRQSTPVEQESSICVAVPEPVGPGDVALVNITPVRIGASGYGALRATGDTPVYDRNDGERFSSVNFAAGAAPNPNLAAVSVDEDGGFCYDSSAEHDVLLDLVAVWPAVDPNVRTAPRRLLDTRGGERMQPDSSDCVEVPDAEPGDGVLVNITNTAATGSGYGTLRSSDALAVFELEPVERRSSVNFAENTPPNPNLAFTRVGEDRRFCYDAAGSSAHVILDLFEFVPMESLVAATPMRLLDTRLLSDTCTPFPTEVAKPVDREWADFTANEFQRVVDLVSNAGIISTSPPSVLGDSVADARIRFLAEQRGYRQRVDVGAGNVVFVAGQQLTPGAAAAWTAMVASARQEGVSLSLWSGYRSTARQRSIFRGKLAASGHNAASVRAGRADSAIDRILRFSSVPGYSRHHTGLAVDIVSPGFSLASFDRSFAYQWLTADNYLNAKAHGFAPSYPPGAGNQGPDPEPWEFVFIGTAPLRSSAEALGSISFDEDQATITATITATVVDADRIIEIYNDDHLVVRARAGCIRANSDEESPMQARITLRLDNPEDVCVIARQSATIDRLLGCSR